MKIHRVIAASEPHQRCLELVRGTACKEPQPAHIHAEYWDFVPGEQARAAYEAYDLSFPHPGWAEQDAGEWVEAVTAA